MTRVFLSAVLALGCFGCTTADVALRSGPVISGQILGGDERVLHVDSGYGVVEVERSDIADIDHPGLGAMVTGASIAMLYAPLVLGGLWVAATDRDPQNATIGQILVFSGGSGLLLGGVIAGVGWWSSHASHTRAFPPSTASSHFAAERARPGLSLRWEF